MKFLNVILCFLFDLDILHKLNRNILNMKYDIKTLVEKNEKLEELILNMSSGNVLSTGNSTNILFEDDVLSYLNRELPLQTDEALQLFESKLMDNIFRSQVVSLMFIIK